MDDALAELRQKYDELQSDHRIALWTLGEAEKDIFVTTLLCGTMTRREFADECARHGLNIAGSYFSVMLLRPIELHNQSVASGPDDLATSFKEIRLIVENILRDISEKFHYKVTSGAIGDTIPIIIAVDEDEFQDDESLDRSVSEFADTLILDCERACGIRLYAVIGQFLGGIDGIRYSYSAARELDEYLSILDIKRRVTCYGDVTHEFSLSISEHIQRSNELELRFRNQVQVGSFSDALQTLREIADLSLNGETDTIQRTIINFNAFRGDITFMIDNMRLKTKNEFPCDFDPMPDILYNLKSIKALLKESEYICQCYEEYTNPSKLKSAPSWLDAMKNYISANLSDPDLNIASISQALGLNAAYSARIFRQYTGSGVLDYIHMLRVEKAEALIKSGMHIKDVARAVGYDNPLRMSRAFKRLKGVSPQEIRNS